MENYMNYQFYSHEEHTIWIHLDPAGFLVGYITLYNYCNFQVGYYSYIYIYVYVYFYVAFQ